MSAARLREAAALMRERAEGSPGPWRVELVDQIVGPDGPNAERVIADYICDGHAEHVASWHPDVARAVADLLDDGATYLEYLAREHPNESRGDYGQFFLAVADAYLAVTP